MKGTTSTNDSGPCTGGDKTKRDHTFSYRWKAPNGEVYDTRDEAFTSRYLNNGREMEVSRRAAHLRGGQPVEAFTVDRHMFIEWTAYLDVALVERPKWAKDLGDLDHDEVITHLYEEVADHRATFRGSKKVEGVGAGDGQGGGGSEES